MRVAKIARRQKSPVSPQFGEHFGKIFSDDLYEDGLPRPRFPYMRNAPAQTWVGMVPNQVVSTQQCSFTPGTGLGTIGVSVASLPHINGHNSEWFWSTKGITAGNRYRSYNGRMYDQNGEIYFSPYNIGQTFYDGDTVVAGWGLEIVYETAQVFLIKLIARPSTTSYQGVFDGGGYGTCALAMLFKSNKSVQNELLGNFDIHYLGRTPDSALGANDGKTTFLVQSHLLRSHSYQTGIVDDLGTSTGHGAKFHLLQLDESVNIQSHPAWKFSLLARVGSGIQGFIAPKQKLLIAFDKSTCRYDEDDRIVGFSFAGADTAKVAESWPLLSAAMQFGLDDNLSVFNVDFTGPSTFGVVASPKLPLPAQWLSAQWLLNSGTSNNFVLSLANGKSWSYVHDGLKYLAVFLNATGFDEYRYSDTTSFANVRTPPALPPLLFRAPINDQGVVSGPWSVTEYPVHFGIGLRERAMLLTESRKRLVMAHEQVRYAFRQLNTPTVDPQNVIVTIDAATGEHEIHRLPEGDQFEIGIVSFGVSGEDVYVLTRDFCQYVLRPNGILPTLSLDKETYQRGDTATLTITVPESCRVKLELFGCRYEGNRNIDVLVAASEQLQLDVVGCVEVHVTYCEPEVQE
ncbi:hypothetical protein O152_gp221 [Pseudomonas phage PaBG]|nr:hypothetical protein O152_gp221 [Pseudomonas phage PaBG]AGS82139.2 hypothetical protein PaBG_00265 [Pseudomonas phage PaBG]